MVEKVDIGIVIALKEEFKELVASINATPHFEPSTSTYYYTFQHTIANTPYNCVTTFINTNDMGLTKAALATERLLQKFSPNIIVNIGIAGSLDSDLSLGDVVVARQTDNYLHNVKAVDNSTNNGFDFILSGDPYKTTEKYINHANSLDLAYQEKFNQWASSCNEKLNQLSASQQSTTSKLEKLKQKGLLKKDPSIHTGNIASSTVLNVSIEFTDWLKKHHDRKCLAIEMESVGVADSAYTHGKEILIIRGISDFSDDRKKLLDNVGRGIFRKYAMYNIISLMWLLLEVDSSTHNKTKTPTKTYYFVLDGTISDFNKPKVEAIMETLKCYTNDSNLQLRELSSGSVIFILQGSEDGYNKLSQLLAENPNLEIDGHKILKLSLTPISKQSSFNNTNKAAQLNKTLNSLVSAQFNQLLLEIDPPPGLIPPTPAAQADRVYALLEWAKSPTGCGLIKVQETLQRILNPLLNISQPQSKVEQLVNSLIPKQNIQNYQASPSSSNNLPANNNTLTNQIIDNSSNKGIIQNMVNPLVNNLKEQISNKKVFLFIGTGVSISASGNSPVASWKGLLKNGVELCNALCNDLPNRWKERVLEDIESSDITDLLSAAEKIQTKLKSLGGQYSRWLRETVGQLQIVDPNILNAIKALDLPIITTNYDDLLEKALGLREITWMDERKIDRFFQGEEKGIFHLHGHWDHPESVILGIRDYQNILNAHIAQSFMQSLRLGGTLLFIGYGAGLQDPNFKTFLDYGTNTLRLSESQHYRLIKEDESSSFTTHHPSGSGIFPIVYGSSHGDLVPFLHSLNP